MKTAEAKTATSPHLHQAGQPFFQKKGEGAFFSDKHPDLQTKPFFNKQQTLPFIQTKLTIGRPGDKYEQEADAMADQVVQRLSNPETIQTKTATLLANGIMPLVQPKCAGCEDEEQLQKKEEDDDRLEHGIQRKAMFESDEPPSEEDIQRKCAECGAEEKLQRKGEADSSTNGGSSSLESRLNASRGSGIPLPEDTRSQMESSFGADFSNVHIHTGSIAVQMNQELHAQAFTHGSDIYFNSGKYNPESTEGKHLLAHELTHTVQQGGRKENDSLQTQFIQLSPLSDELSLLWLTQGKGVFFNRLRQIAPVFDLDVNSFIITTLQGDDNWLALNIATYGRESSWPIHLKVEREMKGWSDSGGKGVVFEMLRNLNGSQVTNPLLLSSLLKVFASGTDDIWLAINLWAYGREANWPVKLQIERAMKGWADSGGVPEVQDILRAANGSEKFNPSVLMAIITELAGASKYDRWLAIKLWQYGPETKFPIHVGIMNFFFKKREEGTINTIITRGLTIKTFTGAFDTWRYHADGRIEEVDISSRLRGNTDGNTIRLNAASSPDSAAMTLYHEVAHFNSTEPDYLEQEIQVRIQSEQFAIDHGLPPTGPNYRKADGTVNEPVIRAAITGSGHYNPTNRTRIGRRYEGEAVIGPWKLP